MMRIKNYDEVVQTAIKQFAVMHESAWHCRLHSAFSHVSVVSNLTSLFTDFRIDFPSVVHEQCHNLLHGCSALSLGLCVIRAL